MKHRNSRPAALALFALLTQHTFAQDSTHAMARMPAQKFGTPSAELPLPSIDAPRDLAQSLPTTNADENARLIPAGATAEVFDWANPTTDGLRFDQGADGTLWARGRSYKASFAGRGATFMPFFGSDAPQNYPIEFRASAVTLAGEALFVETPERAVRSDRTVAIDRAAFVEEYVLEEERLEQRFVFDTLPRRGELVLRIEVETELSGSDFGESLRFSNELGHVDYGAAFAIDANGARIALERSFQDGVIALFVPESFVATAELPLTIDPFVSVFTVAQGTLQKISPDVSYDASSVMWCVVYADVFSASDQDVTAKLFSSTGALTAILTIDATSDYWTTPKVANIDNVSKFFVVSAVDRAPVGSNFGTIFGRLVHAASGTVGPVELVSPTDNTDRFNPDVGGDAHNGSNAHFCVVWEHPVSANISHIEMQMMRQTGTREGGVVTLDSISGRNTQPAISNSNGLVNSNGPLAERWTVAWQYEFASTDHDIYARQVAWNGALLSPAFIVDDSTNDETEPSVASVLDPIAGQRFGLVVYQRNDGGGDEDIIGTLLSGSTVIATRNLSLDDPLTATRRQLSPKTDSDGRHFLVGCVELAPGAYNPNVLISDYFISNGALVPWRVHETLAGTTSAEWDIALSSAYSSGGSRVRYMGAWRTDAFSPEGIRGGFWDGGSSGTVAVACAGDGGGTLCPCGNTGASDSGCANSETSGGRLTGLGEMNVSADTFALHGSNMTAFSTCLYFQGSALNASGAGFIFGDGKLCASGTIIRLGVKVNSNGASQFPAAGDPSVSTLGLIPSQGATRFYQVWYRDSAAFCTNFPFNLTNALEVVWAP